MPGTTQAPGNFRNRPRFRRKGAIPTGFGRSRAGSGATQHDDSNASNGPGACPPGKMEWRFPSGHAIPLMVGTTIPERA